MPRQDIRREVNMAEAKWWKKCVKLAEDSNSNAMVMLDLCAQIYGHTKQIHDGMNKLSEDESRELHNRLASLRDQLDQVLPRINSIARVARNL